MSSRKVVTGTRVVDVYHYEELCDYCDKALNHAAKRKSFDEDFVEIEVTRASTYPEGHFPANGHGSLHFCGPCWREHYAILFPAPQGEDE